MSTLPSAAVKKIRIGDLLVENGLITAEQLQHALSEQRKLGSKLGRTLIDLGMVSENDMLQLLSRQLAIPLIDLRSYRFEPALVRKLPETLARRFRSIVLNEEGGGYVVGMADPTDLFAYDELARVLGGKEIRLALVREDDVLRTFDTVYRRTEEISSLAQELSEEVSNDAALDVSQLGLGEDAADAPVVKLLQSLFVDAVQAGASDIHIEPDTDCLRLRQRVDGVLNEQIIRERQIASALVLRLKLMAGLNISEKRMPQDGRFQISVRGKGIDVRVSTMPVQHGESVVMRLLDQSGAMLDLDYLGMPTPMLSRFRNVLQSPSGIILVTGPTGSGKTTSLYAALNSLNRPEKKVITVEDPVEYRLPRISQVQVNTKIGLDFAAVLRSALRQDPDIILVGEMRDQETAEIGLRAAMTGHLVLSTLHTNDAVGTADRLLDMGAPGYLLAASLRVIIAQRLVRRVCESCGERYLPDDHDKAWLAEMRPGAPVDALRRGRGCQHCNGTGYRGRIGVYEYLEPTLDMLNALRRGQHDGFVSAASRAPLYRPLAQAALDYALDGLSTLEEAKRIGGEISPSGAH
ncbi:GspE/PulE family protein [Silanimonas sp.]|jgi:MSHA biogenesis protein MshE|uniref:GspE/PulE family protein n=1 Tax=Silanimonas sp. TaxID=1929290 RepID=UPI0022CC1933|nr:GspE/PulE family protein [Silanimonas sp.]MCZ8113878.1 GspE/PulE family protein [Silanimonas sp.]